jgi:hypothetical protein
LASLGARTAGLKIEVHVPRQDIEPIGKWRKFPEMAKKHTFLCVRYARKWLKKHQMPAYIIIYFPVLQGDTMELQRGLFLAAISVEKSPLLACIQRGVAAEDGDHFATV